STQIMIAIKHVFMMMISPSTIAVSSFFFYYSGDNRHLHSFPTRRSSDLKLDSGSVSTAQCTITHDDIVIGTLTEKSGYARARLRSEEHTSELQSLRHLVCRLLLEKKKTHTHTPQYQK